MRFAYWEIDGIFFMNISDAQISQCVPDQLHKDIHRISNNDRLHVASIRKFVSDEKYL